MKVKVVRPLTTSGADLVEVRLSRRNLLSLLTKLDDPKSCQTLIKYQGETSLSVIAEEDEDHYQGVTPGRMSERTEREIKSHPRGRRRAS